MASEPVREREPLEDSELRTLLDATDEHADGESEPVATRDRLFVYSLAYVGMRASAIAHMTRDWIDFQDRQIVIPPFQRCTAGRGGGPCSECIKRLELIRADPDAVDTYSDPRDRWDGQKNSLKARARRFERYAKRPGLSKAQLETLLENREGMWFPKSGAGHRPVPVKDDETWAIIKRYFEFHDSVMYTRQTVGNVLTDIARKSDLTRKVEPREMRTTYGTRLAAMDFSPHEIKDAMGHATTQQAKDYVKLAGKRLDDAFSDKWESV